MSMARALVIVHYGQLLMFRTKCKNIDVPGKIISGRYINVIDSGTTREVNFI